MHPDWQFALNTSSLAEIVLNLLLTDRGIFLSIPTGWLLCLCTCSGQSFLGMLLKHSSNITETPPTHPWKPIELFWKHHWSIHETAIKKSWNTLWVCLKSSMKQTGFIMLCNIPLKQQWKSYETPNEHPRNTSETLLKTSSKHPKSTRCLQIVKNL